VSLRDHLLLKPYVGKPAILDSNLLLLYWCAQFNPSLVIEFKRLSSFRPGDFILLGEVLKLFPILKTTPHVLTEVSNLSNSLKSNQKVEWSKHFSRQIDVLPDEWMPASTLRDTEFLKLGITDAMLANLATTHVILTIDFPLSGSLLARNLNAINFTHLRNSLL
jgi:hypothetical protein